MEHAQVDIAFLPEVGTLYPPDDTTPVTVEGLTRQLEGASRPGHLDGLTTVMLKLIHLVGPARLYMGQRHAQQVVIVRHMLRDLFLNLELVLCKTIREDDGLAVSSANALLGIEERHAGDVPLQRTERGDRLIRGRRTIGRGAPLADDRRAGRASRRRGSTT
jgi:pantoate--beta-alanine ligase